MPQHSSSSRRRATRRCLIVERHDWETGGHQQQLQFVLDTAQQFFGPANADRIIQVRVFLPPTALQPAFARQITISRAYANGTRRTNGFPEMGSIPASFVFFEQTNQPDVYEVWWQEDKAIVAASYTGWSQGRNSQYGRGRLSLVVDAPVARPIDRLT